MSQEDIAVVQSAYEVLRRGDVQAIFALLDPEIELYQSEWVPWGGKYKGHEEVGYFFSNLTQTIESRVDPDQFIDDEEGHVVAVGYTREVSVLPEGSSKYRSCTCGRSEKAKQ